MLENLVASYYVLDTEIKGLTKEKNPLNARIKKEMWESNMETVITDTGVTAKLRTQEQVSLNSEKLLSTLQQMELTQAIKTIQTPDQKVVEDMIYNGELDPNVLESCLEKKYIKVLTIKGAK